ncbi:hypothetical protein BC629DRAFT_1437168 [Irpex lacteus]|nr:hypothetical protein BC629DRAFT_1437168 [Irpex lacteus]
MSVMQVRKPETIKPMDVACGDRRYSEFTNNELDVSSNTNNGSGVLERLDNALQPDALATTQISPPLTLLASYCNQRLLRSLDTTPCPQRPRLGFGLLETQASVESGVTEETVEANDEYSEVRHVRSRISEREFSPFATRKDSISPNVDALFVPPKARSSNEKRHDIPSPPLVIHIHIDARNALIPLLLRSLSTRSANLSEFIVIKIVVDEWVGRTVWVSGRTEERSSKPIPSHASSVLSSTLTTSHPGMVAFAGILAPSDLPSCTPATPACSTHNVPASASDVYSLAVVNYLTIDRLLAARAVTYACTCSFRSLAEGFSGRHAVLMFMLVSHSLSTLNETSDGGGRLSRRCATCELARTCRARSLAQWSHCRKFRQSLAQLLELQDGRLSRLYCI